MGTKLSIDELEKYGNFNLNRDNGGNTSNLVSRSLVMDGGRLKPIKSPQVKGLIQGLSGSNNGSVS